MLLRFCSCRRTSCDCTADLRGVSDARGRGGHGLERSDEVVGAELQHDLVVRVLALDQVFAEHGLLCRVGAAARGGKRTLLTSVHTCSVCSSSGSSRKSRLGASRSMHDLHLVMRANDCTIAAAGQRRGTHAGDPQSSTPTFMELSMCALNRIAREMARAAALWDNYARAANPADAMLPDATGRRSRWKRSVHSNESVWPPCRAPCRPRSRAIPRASTCAPPHRKRQAPILRGKSLAPPLLRSRTSSLEATRPPSAPRSHTLRVAKHHLARADHSRCCAREIGAMGDPPPSSTPRTQCTAAAAPARTSPPRTLLSAMLAALAQPQNRAHVAHLGLKLDHVTRRLEPAGRARLPSPSAGRANSDESAFDYSAAQHAARHWSSEALPAVPTASDTSVSSQTTPTGTPVEKRHMAWDDGERHRSRRRRRSEALPGMYEQFVDVLVAWLEQQPGTTHISFEAMAQHLRDECGVDTPPCRTTLAKWLDGQAGPSACPVGCCSSPIADPRQQQVAVVAMLQRAVCMSVAQPPHQRRPAPRRHAPPPISPCRASD